jgi:hypothetical protein
VHSRVADVLGRLEKIKSRDLVEPLVGNLGSHRFGELIEPAIDFAPVDSDAIVQQRDGARIVEQVGKLGGYVCRSMLTDHRTSIGSHAGSLKRPPDALRQRRRFARAGVARGLADAPAIGWSRGR